MVLGAVLFQGVIFIVLILIFRHFMKSHVSGAVDHLQKINDELIKQQTEMKQKMADAEREYETKMNRLTEEIQTKQKQARDDVNKSLDDSRQKAMQEREKIITEAVQTREKMRQEIMGEMEQNAIAYSKNIIAQMLEGELGKLFHERLVIEVIEALKEVDFRTFQILTDTAEFKTPMPIPSEIKQKIGKVLKDKMQKEVKLTEESDPSLIAGVILQFGPLVIDGSLVNRLSEASAQLKKETVRKYQAST